MTHVCIATDSTADIPQSFCDQWNISVVPMNITLGDGTPMLDGVDMTPQEFYTVLETAENIPQTSQVSLSSYLELFSKVYAEGCTDLIHVAINAKGSGSYQGLLLARDVFYEEHPDAKETFRIHAVDSATYSMAYGIAVIEAAQMAAEGAAVDDILSHLQDWLSHSRPLFVPLQLKFVKKSGRISPAAAFVGDAMGLKPVITFEKGEAKILKKVRGEHAAVKMLVDTCLQERKPHSNYALVYGNNDAAYAEFRDACLGALDQPPIAEYPVGCVIGINTGPNMIGILYRT